VAETTRAGATPDVVVFGASSAGVGAAVGAARSGAQVLLVEPTGRVGGMLTNGVTTDMQRRDASTGAFDEWRRLVGQAYRDHPDAELAAGGFNAEPDVALEAVDALLHEPGITVRTRSGVLGAKVEGRRVTEATFGGGSGATKVRAPVFVDATPEGDLLGIVGTEGRDWVVGREGRDVYGESLAPEVGDRLQQAYTYRLTIQVDGRTDYAVPPTYDEDRHRYPLIDRTPAEKGTCDITLADGSVRRYSGMRIQRCLPDRKMDINVDLFGLNHEYPTARRPARRAVERRLAGFVLGYLHWLRTEAGMPELGLPVDDYLDNGGFPTVLYVREGRRARGLETFTQGNAAHDSTWPAEHRWSVAIGEYGLDSHCVGPPGGISGGPTCEGGFWFGARPYSIPYHVMVPVGFDNLLVAAAVSASHVGCSTLRMEPVRMNLGNAAGIAAATAAADGTSVAELDLDVLQHHLATRQQALVYAPEVPPGDPRFADHQLALVRAAGFPSPYRLLG
jgi:hypothetical protein